MDQFIELLKEINIVQIIILFIGAWFFYNRLDAKIDKLGEKIEDVDRRLCRIEGSLASSGHCLFSQSKPEQKAN